ncbi:MAG: guanylate kinase [Bernardetiaceae bacterium]
MASPKAFIGKLLIFCAPSGAGKTTIVQHLLRQFPEHLDFSISATTRRPRPGEISGVAYHFLSREDFLARAAAGDFVEYEEVYQGLYYGTLHSELERIWNAGHHVIFDLDVQGARNLKAQFGDRAYTVFIRPPSLEALAQRLQQRKTESDQKLKERLQKAKDELTTAPAFDAILLNDDLHTCLQEAEAMTQRFLES